MFHVSYKEYIDEIDENLNATLETEYKKYDSLTDEDLDNAGVITYKKSHAAKENFTYESHQLDTNYIIEFDVLLDNLRAFYTESYPILIQTDHEAIRKIITKRPSYNKYFKLSHGAKVSVRLLTSHMTYEDLIGHYPFTQTIIDIGPNSAMKCNIITILRQYGTVYIYGYISIFEPHKYIRDVKKLYALTQFITSRKTDNAIHYYNINVMNLF